MRIAVIGAGAMGAMFGARFARAGAEVVLYDRTRRRRRDQCRRPGGRGRGRRPALRLAATTDPGAIGPVDMALVLVDGNATAAAAAMLAEVLPPDGFALTLQNGIGNVEALAAALGAARSWRAAPTTARLGCAPGGVRVRTSARPPSANSTEVGRRASTPSPRFSAAPTCRSRSATTSSATSG